MLTQMNSNLKSLQDVNTRVLNNANQDTTITNDLNTLKSNFNVASGDIDSLKKKFNDKMNQAASFGIDQIKKNKAKDAELESSLKKVDGQLKTDKATMDA